MCPSRPAPPTCRPRSPWTPRSWPRPRTARATETLPADHVVIRTHGVPDDSLARALRGRVADVHVVGDAVAVRPVDRAIYDGHRAGRAL